MTGNSGDSVYLSKISIWHLKSCMSGCEFILDEQEHCEQNAVFQSFPDLTSMLSLIEWVGDFCDPG